MTWLTAANNPIASVIAFLLTVAVIGIAVDQTVRGATVQIPDTLGTPWALIVGFYFGGHAAANGAHEAGTAAANTAIAAAQAAGTPNV